MECRSCCANWARSNLFTGEHVVYNS
jgi:hypothetical protein